MALGVVRLETQGLFEVGHRLLEPAKFHQDATPVVIGFGIIRIQTEGLLEAGHRLVQVAQGFQDGREIVVRLGGVWPETKRFAERHNASSRLPRACRAEPRLLCASA